MPLEFPKSSPEEDTSEDEVEYLAWLADVHQKLYLGTRPWVQSPDEYPE